MMRHRTSPSLAASQEGTMYVRIVRAQAPPGQVEELARRWQAFWGAQMPQVPGFRHAHFAAGPETNATISISVWEQRPDPATMEPLMEQFRAQVADIAAGPPSFEEYETLADF
jgi:heme-degrading monooxygenase HmoA